MWLTRFKSDVLLTFIPAAPETTAGDVTLFTATFITANIPSVSLLFLRILPDTGAIQLRSELASIEEAVMLG